MLLLPLLWACGPPVDSPSAASSPTTAQPPQEHAVTLELSVDRSDVTLGENVLLHYELTNDADAPVTISHGADYRGVGRHQRFVVVAKGPEGAVGTDPQRGLNLGFGGGGRGGDLVLQPGERFTQSLPLWRYVDLDVPGQWQITVWHDLGWDPEAEDRSSVPTATTAPAASTTLEVSFPDEARARAMIAEALALPTDPNHSFNERMPPHSDFSGFRHPVYLAPLVELVRAGDERGLHGLADQLQPPGTAALITLSQEGPLAQEVRELLLVRTIRGDEGWTDETRADARELAWALLAEEDAAALRVGAQLVRFLGVPADLGRIEAVATTRLPPLVDDPTEQGSYPRPATVHGRLLDAAEALIERGGTPSDDGSFGATAVLAVALRTDTALDADQIDRVLAHPSPHVRAAALDALDPEELRQRPDAIAAALASPWGASIGTGMRAAHRAGDQASVPALTRHLQTQTDKWLLDGAATSLSALQGPLEPHRIAASRLDDPDVASAMFGTLTGLLQINGGGGTIDWQVAATPELRDAWQALLTEHADTIAAGDKVPLADLDRAILPGDWTFTTRDGAGWPPSE